MKSLELAPLKAGDIGEVARFVGESGQGRSTGDGGEERLRLREAVLRWQLLENPLADRGLGIGNCLREPGGRLRGVLLSFGQPFRWGERELVGLAGGGFFTQDVTGLQNYQLFRRYLGMPGADFYFATSCNAQSGALWARLGAKAAALSDEQSIMPMRLGRVAGDLVGTRYGAVAGGAVRLAGAVVNPFWPRPGRGDVTIEPSQDWERLAALAEAHRDRDSITCARTVAYLQWRYEAAPQGGSTVYLFSSRDGEGWFSVKRKAGGTTRQLEEAVLMDMVGPANVDLTCRVIGAAIGEMAGKCDLFVVRGRPRFREAVGRMRMVGRKLGGPTAYAYVAKGGEAVDVDAMDFAIADGDTR